tara:strand:+ start:29640 stop:31586 length:1947 start_codon:yes stop_codon:yes gene_type:complete
MPDKQKRTYVKKDTEYWKNRSKGVSLEDRSGNSPAPVKNQTEGWEQFVSESALSEASSRREVITTQTRTRNNSISTSENPTKFANIEVMQRPFEANGDVINITNAITLCQKAYDNVAIVRNTVEVMVEFAYSEIYLEGGNAQSRKFFESWFKEIKQPKIAEQFFREYYRSSNIFINRIEGDVSVETMKKIRRVSLTDQKIPIKYVLLNPKDISKTPSTIYSDSSIVKLLSSYELQSLKNPKTESDERIFKSLPEETQKIIKKGGYNQNGVYINIDNENIISCFAFKQDYEPFGVPFLYPVLDDVDLKLLYKKTDQQIAGTIENVVLLVTHGANPKDGGVNALVLSKLQEIFANRSVGRTVVADHTTKAEFVIPDLNKVIGPQKYQVVNEDIKDGLQNLLLGSDKFTNMQTKAELFLERIKSVRQKYLEDFLEPEMEMVSKTLGFKSVPKVKFVEISLQDKTGIQRVVTRLLELGILHPEDGLRAIEKNIYPTADQLKKSQERYKEERESGLYNPLVGGVPMIEGAVSNTPTSIPKKENGRPNGAAASVEGMKEFYKKVQELDDFTSKCIKKTLKKTKLTGEQVDLVNSLCQDIIVSCDMENWQEECKSCLKDFNRVKNLKINKDIEEISNELQLDNLSASILYHSKQK